VVFASACFAARRAFIDLSRFSSEAGIEIDPIQQQGSLRTRD
jgi:hypothetical protein